MRFRRLVVLAIAVALPDACGGRTDDAAAPSASTGGIDAGSSEPQDAASPPAVDAATITVRPPAVTIHVLDGGDDCANRCAP